MKPLRQAKFAADDQLVLSFDRHEPSTSRAPGLRHAQVVTETGLQVVDYRLQRARRRSIGLQVDETGLTIRAPRWITLRQIEAAIGDNLRWIRRKQSEWRDRHSRQHVAPALADGAILQYLGSAITLRLGQDRTRYAEADATLWLAQPLHAPATDVAQALRDWLQQQAQVVFAERIESLVGRIEGRFTGWRLSSARTQWGSCSQDGRIRLNWRLVHFSLPIIDYVIAHELAHLKELNHSPRFWNTVARLLPGFEVARDQIRREQLPQW